MLIIAYAHFLYKASFRFLVFGAVSERNRNTKSGGFRLCVFLTNHSSVLCISRILYIYFHCFECYSYMANHMDSLDGYLPQKRSVNGGAFL